MQKSTEFSVTIRLPNNTFTGNANIRVIFGKKRNEMKLDISDEKLICTGECGDGINCIGNLKMMLGKLKLHFVVHAYDST